MRERNEIRTSEKKTFNTYNYFSFLSLLSLCYNDPILPFHIHLSLNCCYGCYTFVNNTVSCHVFINYRFFTLFLMKKFCYFSIDILSFIYNSCTRTCMHAQFFISI